MRPDLHFLRCTFAIVFLAAAFSACMADDGLSNDVQQPEVARELRSRFESDQAIRKKITDFFTEHRILDEKRDLENLDPTTAARFKELGEQIAEEDKKNRLWLKSVIEKHGWPGKSLVGGQASVYAWIIVQHADQDRNFQKECLERMEALPDGEVRPVDIAYLTDRILCKTGKKQKYGTQIELKNGKLVPQSIEDEEHVDERRKALGMESLAEYLRAAEKAYGLSDDSKRP